MTFLDLEAEALRLDPRERVHLAHALVTSLAAASPQQIQEFWLDEAQRRDEEIKAGLVEEVPGPEVFSRIHSRHS